MTVSPDDFLDPSWRLSNLYWITDAAGNKVKFRPNGPQQKFLDEIHNQNIILKARQLGITTLCCLIYLDACLFTPNTRAAIIAHRMDDAKVIFRDKVKFPYDNLDPALRAQLPVVQDSADTLTFSNNSSIRVSVSARSGTLQYLHVSEFGKICAQFPEKAREIVTGALNAVAPGEFITIESTAEGQEGAFFEMSQRARLRRESGQPLTSLDYKFHFFPWWEDPSYALPSESVAIGDDDERYFEQLRVKHGIVLTDGQRRWWVKKAETQAGDMKREYPSTPDEAFEQALEGAYFTHQLYAATKQGRIGGFPYVPRSPVNTFWDLGRNDLNTIWLHQDVDGYDRFIGYYENSGEFIGHYVSWLREWTAERDATFGDQYLPHDGDRQSLWLEEGTMSVMGGLGFYPRTVERPTNKVEAINLTRGAFARCQFDEAACKTGLVRLRTYRKEWDDQRGIWRDRPLHDDASHGADAFMTFACSGHKPPNAMKLPKRDMSWVV
jgi:hypothetical protein